jgi:hypothetical protein
MRLKYWLAVMAGAATLGFAALPAQATTAGGIGTVKAAAAPSADVEQVHWYGRRHYHYRPYYHHRHYYRHYRPGFRFYYGPRHRHWHHRHWHHHHW